MFRFGPFSFNRIKKLIYINMPKYYKWLDNLEDTPENPLTRDRIVSWMADTGYVEGLVGKRISPMDRLLLEDYIQEVWVQILEVPSDKLVEIYRKGKGVITNYIKAIVMNNIKSNSSHLYNNIKKGRNQEVYLDGEGWRNLIEGRKASTNIYYPGVRVYQRHDVSSTLRYQKTKCFSGHKTPVVESEQINVSSIYDLKEGEREIETYNDNEEHTDTYPQL